MHTWQPRVVNADERAAIAARIAAIVDAIDAAPCEASDAVGHGERALVHAYAGDAARAGAELDAAVDALAAGSAGLLPIGGATEVGWLVAHLAGGDAVDELGALIDRKLLEEVARDDRVYDLVSGTVGYGVYGLERGEAGRALATAALAQLERIARPRAGGLGWYTSGEQISGWQRAVAPDGYWNFGLAHGAAGVIAYAARCVAADVEPARARALLDGAVTGLLAAVPAGRPRFPTWQTPAGEMQPGPRLAWCYGDLGVACALAAAAAIEPRWRDEAVELARSCAAHAIDDIQPNEAGLCHGSAGIAHLMFRLHRATGDAAVGEAARRWLAHLVALPVAAALAGTPDNPPGPDASLLTGATGVVLALHAAIAEDEPGWDRLLLVDV